MAGAQSTYAQDRPVVPFGAAKAIQWGSTPVADERLQRVAGLVGRMVRTEGNRGVADSVWVKRNVRLTSGH